MIIDFTGKIGPMLTIPGISDGKPVVRPEAPMFMFAAPAYTLWNELGNALMELWWTEAQVLEWLKSKDCRYALDGELGMRIKILARDYAYWMTTK